MTSAAAPSFRNDMDRPLLVATREAGLNDVFTPLVPATWDVVEVPLTTTTVLAPADVAAALRDTGYPRFATVVVTSARAAASVSLVPMDDDTALLAVGDVTATALHNLGHVVRAVSDDGALGLAPLVETGPVLLLGAVEIRPELGVVLRDRGLEVVHVACYETVPVALTPAQRDLLTRAQAVVAGSPRSWAVAAPHVASDAVVVVPGATTAAAVGETHSRVHVGWDGSLRQTLEDWTA